MLTFRLNKTKVDCWDCGVQHRTKYGWMKQNQHAKPHEWVTEVNGERVMFWAGDRDVLVYCPRQVYWTSRPLTPYPGVPKPREAYGHFSPNRLKSYPDEWCQMCMRQGAYPGHCNHGTGASCCNCEGTRDWILDDATESADFTT